MNPSPGAIFAIPLDADNRLACDLSCSTCGYNLRTQPRDAACPECGRQIVDSLQPDRLCFADAFWLKRLTHGVGWILMALPLESVTQWMMGRFPAVKGWVNQRGYPYLPYLPALIAALYAVMTHQLRRPDLPLRRRMARAVLILVMWIVIAVLSVKWNQTRDYGLEMSIGRIASAAVLIGIWHITAPPPVLLMGTWRHVRRITRFV